MEVYVKFEELYTPINKMGPEEAVAFFLEFCEKRAKSFIAPAKKKKVARKKAAKNNKTGMVSVTPEELALLRKAGLIK